MSEYKNIIETLEAAADDVGVRRIAKSSKLWLAMRQFVSTLLTDM